MHDLQFCKQPKLARPNNLKFGTRRPPCIRRSYIIMSPQNSNCKSPKPPQCSLTVLHNHSMDLEHGKKPSVHPAEPYTVQQVKKKNLISIHPILLRASALSATTVAAVVMGLNKQSYTAVVAIVGTKPLKQTFTAQFKDTPAFVYFVAANAIASLYNLVVVLVMRRLVQGRVQRLVLLLQMIDMVIMVLLATGAAAAASMAELGKNGNLHAHWNPVCNKFGSFCTRGGVSLVCSFVGVTLMLSLNLLSAAANAPNAILAGQ